jgi:hypothetical protein
VETVVGSVVVAAVLAVTPVLQQAALVVTALFCWLGRKGTNYETRMD